MIGISGLGRNSYCKLASFIADCRLSTVSTHKGYTFTDWRDDLKKLLMSTSFHLSQHTVFLFSDYQVTVYRWLKR